MNAISKNIKYLRQRQQLSQEQMADELQISRSRIGSYEEGRSEPNIETLVKLSFYFKLPVDALVKSDLSLAGNKPFIEIGANRILFPITVDVDNNDLIEVINTSASAGYLSGYSDPEYIERLQLMNLPFLPTGKHRAFPIKGDSMPPLGDGSYVIGKFVEDLSKVRNGQTYVVLTWNDGLVYKRVNNHLAEDQNFELVSDNKFYEPYRVPSDEVLEMWEYVCSINTGKYSQEELSSSSIMQMLRQMQVELREIKRT